VCPTAAASATQSVADDELRHGHCAGGSWPPSTQHESRGGRDQTGGSRPSAHEQDTTIHADMRRGRVAQDDEWAEGRRYLDLDIITRAQAITKTEQEVTDTDLQAITA